MNVLKPTDAAYLAGLVDGEGCIAVYHRIGRGIKYTRKGTPYERTYGYYYDFSVTNTNKRLAEYFIEKCGIGLIRIQGGDKPQHRPRHCFVLRSRKEILEFLTEIIDHLILKKPQALLLMELIRSRLQKNIHAPYSEIEEKMISDIRKLNKKGVGIANAIPIMEKKLHTTFSPIERL